MPAQYIAATFGRRDNGQYVVDAGAINSIQQAVEAVSTEVAIIEGFQSVAYAATVTINPALGTTVLVGALTGAITIAAPTQATTGQVLRIILTQDGTGGRVITWNAIFNNVPSVATTASLRKVFQFVYDGTNWTAI